MNVKYSNSIRNSQYIQTFKSRYFEPSMMKAWVVPSNLKLEKIDMLVFTLHVCTGQRILDRKITYEESSCDRLGIWHDH